MKNDLEGLFGRLARSSFRSRFRLTGRERAYTVEREPEDIAHHARELLSKRLFVAAPARDGKQTPYRGHPVFIAQHATGTCCRGCLQKWHGIPKGAALSEEEQDYVVDVIMEWIARQLRDV
jgi:hypothetical protein